MTKNVCIQLKLIYWDGSGIVRAFKRLEEHTFTRPGIKDGLMTLTHAQFEALVAGLIGDGFMRSGRGRRRPSNSCGAMTQGCNSKGKSERDLVGSAMPDPADLPDDAALKAMLIAAQAREVGKDAQIVRKDERIERLEKLVAVFKHAALGRKFEKTDPDQFNLALEDLETAMAVTHAEEEADAHAGSRATKSRATNRGSSITVPVSRSSPQSARL